MRLTNKNKIKELLSYQKNNVLMTDNEHKELKLGQLEDIEDELGISLVVYFKLFKCSHVWAYSNSGKIETNLTGINTWSKTICSNSSFRKL